MLSHSDIRTLSELAYLEQERVSIRALADRLDWSGDHTARIVSDLESRGYVTAERVGGQKQVALAFVRPVEEFVDLAREFAHVDFADLIAGSALRILYYLETDRTATELAELTGLSRSTVYRRLDRLQNVGIVYKDHSRYALTPDFTGLAGFARAVATHEHRMEVRAHGVEPRLVWESLDEYLFECRTDLSAEAFHETGPAVFERYGVALLTRDRNYYIRSERIEEVTPAELVCHTLLIDDDTRYRSYCLLLIAKHDLDEESLQDVAAHYDREAEQDLRRTVEQLCAYLRSSGEVAAPALPAWTEFKSLAAEYGIEV